MSLNFTRTLLTLWENIANSLEQDRGLLCPVETPPESSCLDMTDCTSTVQDCYLTHEDSPLPIVYTYSL